MAWILGSVAALAVLVALWNRRRRRLQEDFVRELEELGLTAYHRDLMRKAGRDDFMRSYMIFVAMQTLLRRRRDGLPVRPQDPVEERAFLELVEIGRLRPDERG